MSSSDDGNRLAAESHGEGRIADVADIADIAGIADIASDRQQRHRAQTTGAAWPRFGAHALFLSTADYRRSPRISSRLQVAPYVRQ